MAVKVSVNLSDEAASQLKRMADGNGITVTGQLQRSVETEVWREQVEKSRGRILVEDSVGRVYEVRFRW